MVVSRGHFRKWTVMRKQYIKQIQASVLVEEEEVRPLGAGASRHPRSSVQKYVSSADTSGLQPVQSELSGDTRRGLTGSCLLCEVPRTAARRTD